MKSYLLIFSLFTSFINVSLAQTEPLPCVSKDGFFKAEFNLMGSNMNGFLAVKQKSSHVLHVAFTSPMGNNLLEMRWKKGKWKRKFAIKKLKNKKLFQMLSEDILLLFSYQQYDKGFEDLGNVWKWNKKTLTPKFDEDGKLVSVRIVTKRHRPSKTVKYNYDGICVSKMSIDHQGFPFSIVLEPLEKN